MKRLVLLLMCFALAGCGIIPGGGRLVSDYNKTSSYMMYGGSKTRVGWDFGKPDEKYVYEDKSEIWIYNDRQDGKTFAFVFSPKGAIVQSSVGYPEELDLEKLKDYKE